MDWKSNQEEDLMRSQGVLPSGCLNLNCIKIQAVNSPNTPRKTMTITPGTRPTTASDEGKESIPLLTISAIMRTATSSQDSVLYLIFEGVRVSQRSQLLTNRMEVYWMLRLKNQR